MQKISVIIPVYDHYEETESCIDSILKYTDYIYLQNNVNIIIVDNGSTLENYEKLKAKLSVFYAWGFFEHLYFEQPLGFPKAVNAGIKVALSKYKSDYLILLNNDCILLKQEKNAWIHLLLEPIEKREAAVTGPKLLKSSVDRDFVPFFCAAIGTDTFMNFGLLNETFSPGYYEDAEFCHRIEDGGGKIKLVCPNNDFPIYHKGEVTVGEIFTPEIIARNTTKLNSMFRQSKLIEKSNIEVHQKHILVDICTRGRYDSTLPMALSSVVNQKLVPDKIVLYDDTPNPVDLREIFVYKSLFALMDKKKIKWEVVFGNSRGQVLGHQHALDKAESLIYRCDDDEITDSDCLGRMYDILTSSNKIGAVSTLVLNPLKEILTLPYFLKGKIEEIYLSNVQWYTNSMDLPMLVAHLHSTFLYRKEAGQHGYCKDLSPVGHREETIFTYEMKRVGWDLAICPSDVVTWHLQESKGGIRAKEIDANYFVNDEKIFETKMIEWGIKPKQWKFIILDNGLGDHLAFLNALDDKLEEAKEHWVIACCYPDVFKDWKNVISIAQATAFVADLGSYNIYGWMDAHNWKNSIVEAFKGMYKI